MFCETISCLDMNFGVMNELREALSTVSVQGTSKANG